MGSSVDGYTSCELSEATRILYNGYSEIGGYNLSYDTDVIKAYPIEMPGGIMTEQADFQAQYGAAMTVRLDDANTSMMVIDSVLEKAAAAAPVEEESDSQTENAEEAETGTIQETVEDEAGTAGADSSPLEGSIVIIASDDGATQIGLFEDGSYTFYFEQHGVTDSGTYAYDGSVLILTNAGGTECISETADGTLTLHYVTSISDQLTGDYTINLEDLSAVQ